MEAGLPDEYVPTDLEPFHNPPYQLLNLQYRNSIQFQEFIYKAKKFASVFVHDMNIFDKFDLMSIITSSSERYMSSQLEKTRSMELSSILSSGDVTSAHMKVMLLWMCPLISSFCRQSRPVQIIIRGGRITELIDMNLQLCRV